ncbi:hypothetical protein C8Q75DRAFT_482450 [Abortiporus biennis]|nr:hypothetical protein C8Q75DRAFT_482450 [Abortiporus biennis]
MFIPIQSGGLSCDLQKISPNALQVAHCEHLSVESSGVHDMKNPVSYSSYMGSLPLGYTKWMCIPLPIRFSPNSSYWLLFLCPSSYIATALFRRSFFNVPNVTVAQAQPTLLYTASCSSTSTTTATIAYVEFKWKHLSIHEASSLLIGCDYFKDCYKIQGRLVKYDCIHTVSRTLAMRRVKSNFTLGQVYLLTNAIESDLNRPVNAANNELPKGQLLVWRTQLEEATETAGS